jgi:glycosyltransferase involved in cell wall biosynthesis
MTMEQVSRRITSNSDCRPAASVLLPVYNAEKYLAAAVKSVLAQDYRNFEVLLLNDGSTDGSAAILERFAALDSRCKVHAWPNRGLIATLNAGIQLAAGDVLIRMDADDICRPNRFSRQMTFMQEHPECVAVGSRVMLIDAEGWPITEFFGDELDHNAIDAAHLRGKGGSIVHPSAAISRRAMLQIGGYRPNYPHSEDFDLFLRLAEVGKLANLPEVLLDYRQHADSIGYRYSRVQWESARRAVSDACERRRLRQRTWGPDPVPERAVPSRADMHRKWGWWALGGGNRRTARKHAFKALSISPFDAQTLKLCACVLRGR